MEISNQSISSGNSDISFIENDFFVVLGYIYIKKIPQIFHFKEILNWINQMILIDYNYKIYMSCFLLITN